MLPQSLPVYLMEPLFYLLVQDPSEVGEPLDRLVLDGDGAWELDEPVLEKLNAFVLVEELQATCRMCLRACGKGRRRGGIGRLVGSVAYVGVEGFELVDDGFGVEGSISVGASEGGYSP